MNGMPRLEVISLSVPAVSICSCSDSTTQGPAMRKKGWSSPTEKLHSFISPAPSGDGLQQRLAGRLVVHRGLDEGIEQRVAVPWGGFEFRVELHAHEPGMHLVRQFDYLRQVLALGHRRDHEARLAQLVEIVDVGFVAMAVPLGD